MLVSKADLCYMELAGWLVGWLVSWLGHKKNWFHNTETSYLV